MRDAGIMDLALAVADAALKDRGEVPPDIRKSLSHLRHCWVEHAQSRRRVSMSLRMFVESVHAAGIEMPPRTWHALYAALDWIRGNGTGWNHDEQP